MAEDIQSKIDNNIIMMIIIIINLFEVGVYNSFKKINKYQLFTIQSKNRK